MGHPQIIAHRGAWAPGGPAENTVAAFARAAALGADWVEFDVRRTADLHTAIHHDATLADGRPIVSLRRAELPADVPDLDRALQACRGLGVNVEIKNFAPEPDYDPEQWLASETAGAVGRAADPLTILVSSFNADTIDRLHELAPDLPTALLTFALDDAPRTIEWCAARGHRALHPFERTVDRSLIEHAHRAGLLVNTWTVDDPQRMVELAAMGVDGICTNRVDLARAALLRG